MASSSEHVQQQLELEKKELDERAQKKQQVIEVAIKAYQEYAATQKGFTFPEVKIQLEENPERVDVHMDVAYGGVKYHFESLKSAHLKDIYEQLYNQPIVMQKFGDGKIKSREYATERVDTLSKRFMRTDDSGQAKEISFYSGFAVTDSETDTFLGMSILGRDPAPGTAQSARLNTVQSWGQMPTEIVQIHEASKRPSVKVYHGVGTTEVCTMMQYAEFLKKNKHKIGEHELKAVVATARVDNPGSWKSNAKAGMEVTGVDNNPDYGPELRYQLCRKI